jgi:hypothetical protein
VGNVDRALELVLLRVSPLPAGVVLIGNPTSAHSWFFVEALTKSQTGIRRRARAKR